MQTTFKNLVRQFAVASITALGFCACAAAASCVDLLVAEKPNEKGLPKLELSSCDVVASVVDGRRGKALVLELKQPARGRWHAALAAGGTHFEGLLLADLRITPFVSSLPDGTLLASYSARMVREALWTWSDRDGVLRLDAPLAPPPASVCSGLAPGVAVLWFGTREVVPGGILAPNPQTTNSPSSFFKVPPGCVSGWTLSDGAPAALIPEWGVVAIAPTAPDGALFTLRTTVGGKAVEGQVRVTVPALHPLAGTWRQTTETPCGGGAPRTPARPIGEVVFAANGDFSLTWQPFEAYRDFWGNYQYDAKTQKLSWSALGGNRLPTERIMQGTARIDADGTLRIEGLNLATDNSQQTICEVRFRRVGA